MLDGSRFSASPNARTASAPTSPLASATKVSPRPTQRSTRPGARVTALRNAWEAPAASPLAIRARARCLRGSGSVGFCSATCCSTAAIFSGSSCEASLLRHWATRLR